MSEAALFANCVDIWLEQHPEKAGHNSLAWPSAAAGSSGHLAHSLLQLLCSQGILAVRRVPRASSSAAVVPSALRHAVTACSAALTPPPL